MQNPIKLIYQFNQQAGFLETGYSDTRECAFPIEEMLEGFDTSALFDQLAMSDFNVPNNPKEISRAIMDLCDNKSDTLFPISDVERLDKHLDAIVFCFGSIFKLGLTRWT